MSRRIPLTVLTGFLGSGKTTLLARMLTDPRFGRTAVIVNEFGEVGLDHHLLEPVEADLVELGTGCLCCRLRGDLVETVARLLGKRERGEVAFERIVLETSGLADPAPILQTAIADGFLARHLELRRVVTLVDALGGAAVLGERAEAWRQVALADVVLITKMDLAPDPGGRLAETVRRINPGCRIASACHGEADPGLILGTGMGGPLPGPAGNPPAAAAREAVRDGAEGFASRDATSGGLRDLLADLERIEAPPPTARHHRTEPEIGAVLVRRAEPVRAVALTLALQVFAETYGPDLLRIKGLVSVAESPGQPAVVQGVQHVFHPLRWLQGWPDGSRETRLVAIGRRLDGEWMAAVLEQTEHEVRQATQPQPMGQARATAPAPATIGRA